MASMHELERQIADLKGICVSNTLLIHELFLVVARVAPERIDETLELLERVAGRSLTASDRTKLHLNDSLESLREQLRSRSESS